MTVLRVDPWDPQYGASVENDEDPDRPPPPVDFPEPVPWAAIRPPAPQVMPCYAFVDGIRRVDRRLFAEEGTLSAPALAGTWAVGAAWSSRPPTIDDVRVGRIIVTGRGLDHPDLTATVGSQTLIFHAEASDARTPDEVLQKLQNTMRDQEKVLADHIAQRGQAEIIIQDGPLSYQGAAPAVGMIKRQVQRYLDAERQKVVSTLEVGERSPLFLFESRRLERFSWYARIACRRAIDGTLAGLVRLEVRSGVGLDEARRLAGSTAAVLPMFAAPMWRDSRSPQNLFPVGQLETLLRSRMGDGDLVRRALESALWKLTADG